MNELFLQSELGRDTVVGGWATVCAQITHNPVCWASDLLRKKKSLTYDLREQPRQMRLSYMNMYMYMCMCTVHTCT